MATYFYECVVRASGGSVGSHFTRGREGKRVGSHAPDEDRK